MLRAALIARQLSSSRSFVSTVLLTRNWENETLVVLKKEAKLRGLLQYVLSFGCVHVKPDRTHTMGMRRSGNKATLITRLQEHEKHQQLEVSVPPTPQLPKHQQVRHASTAEVPGQPSSSNPTPIPPSYPKDSLDVIIPSGYQPTPEVPVQIVRWAVQTCVLHP